MLLLNKYLFSIIFIVSVSIFDCLGQEIVFKNVEVTNREISFDLSISKKKDASEKYSIAIFSSLDGFQTRLQSNQDLTNLSVDSIYHINLNAEDLLRGYKGDLSFKFKAVASVYTIDFINLPAKILKNKEYLLEWEDLGEEKGDFDLLLYEGNKEVLTIANNVTDAFYTWKVPRDLRVKGDYQIRLQSNKFMGVKSDKTGLNIRPLVPIYLKVAPGLIGGGIALLLLNRSTPSNDERGLPNPPDFPE